MRTYSGFLLLEDVLDYLPASNGTLYNFAKSILNPVVTVVSEDCGTTLGKIIEINYEVEGRIELSTGNPITETRILNLLALGIYKIAIRSLDSCVALNGVCRTCYHGTFLDLTSPAIGTKTKIVPEYNYQTDVARGDGVKTVFDLTEDPANYTKVLVIQNGVIMLSGYIISGLTITLTVPPALGVNIVIHYYKNTAQPFMGYLANTYSGSLLGLKALPTQAVHLRPSLFHIVLSDVQIDLAKEELNTAYPLVTAPYIDYIGHVKDKLEKSLYIAVLYGLYSNVTS